MIPFLQRLGRWLADLEQERRRWLCRRFGHDLTFYEGVALEFPWCRRCGKWGRRVSLGELTS